MVKFFKPVIKFISKPLAIKELKLTRRDFERLCVCLSIYPVVGEQRHCMDRNVKDFYYLIEDIKFIGRSDAYVELRGDKRRQEKKQRFLEDGLVERANRVKSIRMQLIPLVKQKYHSFGESLCNLGNSLRFLHLAHLFRLGDYSETLGQFEEFIRTNSLLKFAFMSKTGIYYQFDVEDKMIVWRVPYPIKDFETFYTEHLFVEKKEIEALEEFAEELGIREIHDAEFEPEQKKEEEETLIERYKSYLSYGAPILEMHAKILLSKLKTLPLSAQDNILAGMQFDIQVKSISDQIEFAIRSRGGEVVSGGKYVICETVENVENDKTYIQSQFVFDCINSNQVLDTADYLTGKSLPSHTSPFKSIFEFIDEDVINALSNTKKIRLMEKIKKFD